MSEDHEVRLRAAWEWWADGPEPPQPSRIDLPCAVPSEWTGPVRLRRKFGMPARAPASVVLRLANVSGLREVWLNGELLAPLAASRETVVVLPVPGPPRPRNILELVVDGATGRSTWGQVSLVFRAD